MAPQRQAKLGQPLTFRSSIVVKGDDDVAVSLSYAGIDRAAEQQVTRQLNDLHFRVGAPQQRDRIVGRGVIDADDFEISIGSAFTQ